MAERLQIQALAAFNFASLEKEMGEINVFEVFGSMVDPTLLTFVPCNFRLRT